MRKLLVIGALLLASLSSAQVASTTTYRYLPDEATKEYCKKRGKPLPTGELLLREDGSFLLTMEDEDGLRKTRGTYKFENDDVRFVIDVGSNRDLPKVMKRSKRALSGKGAAFLLKVDKGPEESVESDGPKKPSEAPPAPDPEIVFRKFMEGTWHVWRKGQEDRSIKMTFNPDGTFKCVIYLDEALTSSGKVEYDWVNRQFTLIYKERDGKPVPPEGYRPLKITLTEENEFVIEKSLYRKKQPA